jgi:subtilisin family serine protease
LRIIRTLAVAITVATVAATAQQAAAAQPATSGAQSADGAYVVQLQRDADARGLARALQVSPRFTYRAALNGFAADLTAAQLRALAANPAVVRIEPDASVENALDETQTNPPAWGIDRIDERRLPLDLRYRYGFDGTGVHAYVIDTGIDVTHPDFEGRATADFNAFGGPNVDCNGHGTHVAGTIGSETYGVAKNVRLHAVRWLNCAGAGNLSGAVAAVDWVTANAQRPAVANTSWNFGWSDTLAAALTAMMNSGVFLATSGGNTGANSCDRLPRGLTATLAVGATTITDTRAGFSSTGPCVDLYAPGVSILSTQPNNTTALFSGTSMATPHAAGVAVLYKDEFGDANQATVSAHLTGTATRGVVQGNLVDTPNLLLFSSPDE